MISFENNMFHLKTCNTSYVIGITEGIPIHLYWGKRLSKLPDLEFMLPQTSKRHLVPSDITFNNHCLSTDNLTMEYPTFGSVDLRKPAFHAKYKDGSTVTKLVFDSYSIENGKLGLNGLPGVYAENGDNVQTLSLVLKDDYANLKITLVYSVFENFDAITRSVLIENTGNEAICIRNALSANVDFKKCDYEMIHLPGAWCRERIPQRAPLITGTQEIESLRGASGSQHNPFFALVSKGANEQCGEAYGFSLVYSGNFTAGVQVDPYNVARAYIGTAPFNSERLLEKSERFAVPEAVLVYSDNGIGGMSRIYHRLYRKRLCRGKYRDAERFVLVNNWEATYFDFNAEKITEIAKSASELGIELLVLDDGWFGKRNNDRSSLGDWKENLEKLPEGLHGLAEQINKYGMKFGLWFEPEMISPDSELYRKHSDWCIHTRGRVRSEERHQLTLDLTRKEVCDYIISFMSDILGNCGISYVKWDMNRNMTEVGSAALGADRQEEVYRRYMDGLYSIMEALTDKFPNILFEGCASGGGRYDPGMLYYMPQIWTSDDTDVAERLMIQYGTSLCYPYSTMGAHVSAVPNHQTGRTIPFKFRCDVALPGQFGFELDLSLLSEEEKKIAAEKIIQYKELREVFHKGDLYRILTPENGRLAVNEFIADDGKTVAVCIYSLKGTPNNGFEYFMLQGLDANGIYEDENGNKFPGDFLMNVGIRFCNQHDYISEIKVYKKVN